MHFRREEPCPVPMHRTTARARGRWCGEEGGGREEGRRLRPLLDVKSVSLTSHYLLGYISFSSLRGHDAEQAKSPLGPVLQGEHRTSCSISYQLGVRKPPPAMCEKVRERERDRKRMTETRTPQQRTQDVHGPFKKHTPSPFPFLHLSLFLSLTQLFFVPVVWVHINHLCAAAKKRVSTFG